MSCVGATSRVGRRLTRGARRAFTLGLCLVIVAFFSACGGKEHAGSGAGITFVHATDPHFFLPADPKDAGNTIRDKQQDGDEKATVDMFQDLRYRGASDGRFAFLILTGDLGVDPCLIAKDDKDCVKTADSGLRDAEIARLVKIFQGSPIQDIYLVAGNNDLAHEVADGPALDYFNAVIDEMQQKLAAQKSTVRLHNLTRCYADSGGGPSGCYSDIAEASYRLVGFPSYSFKNSESDDSQTQAKQLETFRAVMDDARHAGKRALIVSHIPDMDDPFFLAQYRFDGKSRGRPKADESPNPDWFAWNVSKQVADAWNETLGSDSVAAVFAGHLHDSHERIYRRPYTWTTVKNPDSTYRKLFLAPPLSVKNQDTSPIQARGYSIVSLEPDRIEANLFWYDSETGHFTPDAKKTRPMKTPWRPSAWRWLWNLDATDSALIRFAILAIALLTAFLTIVAIWQFPSADNPLAPKSASDATNPTSAVSDTSPFASRFGKTVIAGLGGLVAAEVTKTLGNQESTPDSKWFYIVWFITWFFVLLVVLNLWRAMTEALRAHVAIPHYPLARPPKSDPVGYWALRILHWAFSWRIPALTFADTFVNLIQGKNQTVTKAFADQVIDQQANLVRVIDSIRQNLNQHIEAELPQEAQAACSIVPRVRVNISVLSADQSNVFYISRTPGSAPQLFPKQSMAWVSVFTGEIRWYKNVWREPKGTSLYDRLVLFDNSGKTIADATPGQLMLSQYYQSRPDEDYKAFILLPVPYPHRGYGSNYVKGAIHISFRDSGDMESIWDAVHDPKLPEQADVKATYPPADEMLGTRCKDADIRAALRVSIVALGELLRGFNEVIFSNYIEPNRTD